MLIAATPLDLSFLLFKYLTTFWLYPEILVKVFLSAHGERRNMEKLLDFKVIG